MIRRHQRERDAKFVTLAEQVLRVMEPEGKAQQRRVWRERDVAFVPGQPDAERFLAVVHLLRHDADIAHGGGIRPGIRACQRKARYFLSGGKPGQVVFLLRVSAEFFDEFTRSERVGHHHDGRDVRTARGDLADDQ